METIRRENGNGWAQRYSNIMQTFIVVGLGISAIWAGVLYPLQLHLNEVADKVASSTDLVETRFLTIREHTAFQSRIDEDIKSLKELIEENQKSIVYLRDNQITKETTAMLRSDIDTLRRDFSGQYTVAEKIKDLQEQIAQLQQDMIRPQFPMSIK